MRSLVGTPNLRQSSPRAVECQSNRSYFLSVLSQTGLSSTFRPASNRSRLGGAGNLASFKDRMDYEIQRCTRFCAASGRPLDEGEEFYSVLVAEKAQCGDTAVRRYDYALETWKGAPEGTLGWWKSRIPSRDSKKPHVAPGEVLLQLFNEFEGVAEKQDMRYVLSLLLVRRRVLRLEETEHDESGSEILVLYSPSDEATHRVTAVVPGEERTRTIQEELDRLLFAGAT